MSERYFAILDPETGYPTEVRTITQEDEADFAEPYVSLTKEQLDQAYSDNQDAHDLSLLWSELRKEREVKISECEWMYHRHKQELELAMVTSLSVVQYNEYLAYMQSLRDVTEGVDHPDNVVWPEKPAFI